MAQSLFSRSLLKSLGLSEEVQQTLIDAHTEVTEALKQQRDAYKTQAEQLQAEADKVGTLQEELNGLKGGEDFKSKYEAEHSAFEQYKTQIQQEAETAKVKTAYRKLLEGMGINPKAVDAIARSTDYSGMKCGDDGELAEAENLKQKVSEEWAGFIPKVRERGPKVETPPKQDGGAPFGEIRQMGAERRAARYGALPNKPTQEG